MHTIKQIFSGLTLIVLLVGIVVGLIGGYFLFKARDAAQNQLTSQIIVDRVTKQGFLVTRSVYLDQTVSITVDKGSGWSNFWWGQQITANALTKVDVGVDLTTIKSEQVHVDQGKKTICLVLPAATVQDVTISGDISVKNKQGILKLLLANKPNQDFNQAKMAIEREAQSAVQSRSELMDEAQHEVVPLLQTLVGNSGYTVSSCQ